MSIEKLLTGRFSFWTQRGTFVEVETSPQVFEKPRIETGLSDGLTIEIMSGLTDEDRIKNPESRARSAAISD